MMRNLGNGWPIPKVIVAAAAAAYFGTRQRVGVGGIVALVLCLAVVGNNLADLIHG
jgi:hypothetical protein